MGLHITATIHQIDDLVIDDIQALNDDLMANSGFGELYGDFTVGQKAYQNNDTFQGPFRVLPDGTLQIACNGDGSFEEYGDYTTVWGCFDQAVVDTIAKHVTEGKIVFYEDVEGNPGNYYIITPGKVQHKSTDDIRF